MGRLQRSSAATSHPVHTRTTAYRVHDTVGHVHVFVADVEASGVDARPVDHGGNEVAHLRRAAQNGQHVVVHGVTGTAVLHDEAGTAGQRMQRVPVYWQRVLQAGSTPKQRPQPWTLSAQVRTQPLTRRRLLNGWTATTLTDPSHRQRLCIGGTT